MSKKKNKCLVPTNKQYINEINKLVKEAWREKVKTDSKYVEDRYNTKNILITVDSMNVQFWYKDYDEKCFFSFADAPLSLDIDFLKATDKNYTLFQLNRRIRRLKDNIVKSFLEVISDTVCKNILEK